MSVETEFQLDNSRQSGLVPAERLDQLSISVIGVGAIGRQVALQLTSIGATCLTLVDHDRVDASNVCTQGYSPAEIGEQKVDALADTLRDINPGLECSGIVKPWKLERDGLSRDERRWLDDASKVVFCCVDNMETRAAIHREMPEDGFFVDGRMLAEVGFVYPSYSEVTRLAYIQTLFSDEEAEEGQCTQKGTIYCANHVASAMVHQFVKWLRYESPLGAGGFIGAYERVEEYKHITE